MACNILIVDDSATTRAMIKRVIRMSGVPVDQTLEAPDGKVAMGLLAQHPIDIVLADLHMPEMTGLELTRAMQANPATSPIPIVIISAEPNTATIEALEKEGIRGHLRKPFTPEALRTCLTDLLGVIHG
ncbi:MAG: response regulator [Phycisphaerae bacterium]